MYYHVKAGSINSQRSCFDEYSTETRELGTENMDRRVKRTHAAIMEAYFELVKDKRTTRVTISDIARQADIDRKTFYLHFDSVDQILDAYIDQRIEYLDSLLEQYHFFDVPFNVENIYQIIEEAQDRDIEYLKVLSSSDSYNELWERAQKKISEKAIEINRGRLNCSEKELHLLSDYFVSGVTNVYRKWLNGDYGEDEHEMLALMTRITEHGLEYYLKKEDA